MSDLTLDQRTDALYGKATRAMHAHMCGELSEKFLEQEIEAADAEYRSLALVRDLISTEKWNRAARACANLGIDVKIEVD